MDIISHGLWGGALFGRKNRRDFWWSFVFGIAPDFLSFGVFTIMTILGLASSPNWREGPPPESSIPFYVHSLYNLTHSLVIFILVFTLFYFFRRKIFYPMFAWLLHILLDIPTHSTEFFPTPFLWPFFDNIRVNGIPWVHPLIFIPNIILLFTIYLWFFYIKPKRDDKKLLSKYN